MSTTTAAADPNQQENGQNAVAKYKWDWIEKLNDSPFRREIQRLKRDSKQNPGNKAQNAAFKRQLRAKEKELLVDFQMKCDQAKIWINDANAAYANENSDNSEILQRIAYQRKQEKVNTIDQFWAELLCQQQIFLQNTKIKQQATQMAELQKQLDDAQQALQKLNAAKQPAQASQNGDQKVAVKTASPVASSSDSATSKKTTKKKKQKRDREQYQGLVGFFNRPQKPSTQKQKQAIAAKTGTETPDENVRQSSASKEPVSDILSFSCVPEHLQDGGDDTKKENDAFVEDEPQSDPSAAVATTVAKTERVQGQKKEKSKHQKAPGPMKGGFLGSGSKGLYDDKKSDADLSVNELNAKNAKQIEEMGLKDAVDSPFFSWERPKQAERAKGNVEAPENRPNDPLTQYLDAQGAAKSANTASNAQK